MAVFRELAEVSPDRYRPDLAQSLSSLGVTLSGPGPPDRRPVGRPGSRGSCTEILARAHAPVHISVHKYGS